MGRVGGILNVLVNGTNIRARGEWTWNLGIPKREMLTDHLGVVGYTEENQVPMIEGNVTDTDDLDATALLSVTGATCVLERPNGKPIILREAVQTADGAGTTSEGQLPVKFEGMSAEEDGVLF